MAAQTSMGNDTLFMLVRDGSSGLLTLLEKGSHIFMTTGDSDTRAIAVAAGSEPMQEQTFRLVCGAVADFHHRELVDNAHWDVDTRSARAEAQAEAESIRAELKAAVEAEAGPGTKAPSQLTLTLEERADRLLQEMFEWNDAGDYGQALAYARMVSAVNGTIHRQGMEQVHRQQERQIAMQERVLSFDLDGAIDVLRAVAANAANGGAIIASSMVKQAREVLDTLPAE